MSFHGDDAAAAARRYASSSRATSIGPTAIGSVSGLSATTGGGSRAFLSRLEDSMTVDGSSEYGGGAGDYGYGGGEGAGGMDVDGGDGRGAGAAGGMEDRIFTEAALSAGPDEVELDEVRRLVRVWVRERGTPAVLAWAGELVDSLLDKLEQQAKMLDTLRSDPATSEEEHFRLVLVQTEMERAKYLVRSYVRVRLHKIEKYARHIVDTPELSALLSGAELQHAERYADLVDTHFQSSVLDSLPEWLRRTDDSTNDGVSMVSKPNLDAPVLVYCRNDCGEITLEGGEIAVLSPGTTHFVKYSLVDRWIALGWAEVL